jgi:dTDP-glucose 4,6-dehydratase
MRRFLVTGGAGFAGHHIVEEILSYIDAEVTVLDCLTYAGRLDRLAHLDKRRIKYIHHDLRQPISDQKLGEMQADVWIHNAAESHVARSFNDPRLFVESNIMGTFHLLDAANRFGWLKKFIYVSTDEVFGPATAPFREDDALAPTNPYAATKAGGELLAYAYFRSFGLPVIITRTMNMFGERQHPEKCVPLMIKTILQGGTVPVHGEQIEFRNWGSVWASGSRRWLHARDQANALMFLAQHGSIGEKYNIAGVEKTNYEIVNLIGEIVKAPTWGWEYVEAPQPVHDFSYSLNDEKIRALGWIPPRKFETAFEETVKWTAAHREWLEE